MVVSETRTEQIVCAVVCSKSGGDHLALVEFLDFPWVLLFDPKGNINKTYLNGQMV